jgi:ribonuclease BN (tRNA processing enzyme)
VELVILGVGGGYPRAGGAACGYLLRQDGFNLWLDLGTGTMASLQAHIELFDVDAIAVSHRHFDHFLDLYPYFLARSFRRGAPALPILPVYGPPGFFGHAVQLEENLATAFEERVVEPGASFEAGPFRVRTAPMRHPVPTLGMRIESNASVLAYSADTGPTDELVALARGADVLLSVATYAYPDEGPPELQMSPALPGQHATAAGVGRLVIPHMGPANDRDLARERAAGAFDAEIIVAEEGLRVSL